MSKKNPYLKNKIVEVSSRSLFGRKSEKDKTIEKWTDLGWVLKKDSKVRGKERYILTFEYQMSDDEIEFAAKRQRNVRLGCVGLLVIVVIIGLISSSQQNASIAATRTFEGTEIAYANATLAQQSINDTATATLWTPTFTPTPSDTPTITYTPSITFTPSITPTFTASATITETPLPSATVPTDAPPVTYYVRSLANVRSCERTSCDKIDELQAGTTIQVVGTVQGDNFAGSTTWERIIYNGQTGYVHSSLVSINPPPTAAPRPVVVPQQQFVSTVPPIPAVNFVPDCSGDVYNCPMLSCAEVRIYAASCPGDPSDLDHDGNGLFCESDC